MKLIPLTQGQFAIVDDEDFEFLNQWKWYYKQSKNERYGYAVRSKNKIRMHRVLMKLNNSKIYIDHINNNGLDNRRENLRIVTPQQNVINSSKRLNTTSKYKGVCFNKNLNKWGCYIKINKKQNHLGLFKSEIDAAKAYNLKAIELFGDYANLNKFD